MSEWVSGWQGRKHLRSETTTTTTTTTTPPKTRRRKQGYDYE